MDLNKWWSLFCSLARKLSKDVPFFSYHVCHPIVHVLIQQTFVKPYNILGPVLDMVLVLKELVIWSDANRSLEFAMHA